MNPLGLGRPVNTLQLGKPISAIVQIWNEIVTFVANVVKNIQFKVEA